MAALQWRELGWWSLIHPCQVEVSSLPTGFTDGQEAPCCLLFLAFLLGGREAALVRSNWLSLEGRVAGIILPVGEQPRFPKPMLAESEVYIKCGDGGGGILGGSGGHLQGGCGEAPGMGLHLGSKELESCGAAGESHSAALSVLRKPNRAFVHQEGPSMLPRVTQPSQASLDLWLLTVTQTVSFSVLPSLGSGQGGMVPMRGREVRGVILLWRQLPDAVSVNTQKGQITLWVSCLLGYCTYACKVLFFSGVFTHA